MADTTPPSIPDGPAGHWLGIVDRAHDLIAPRIDGRKKQHVEDVLHQLEADLAPLVGPLVQRILDNPATSADLAALVAEAGAPGHQFGSLVVGFAIGAVIGPALGAALDPEIEGIRKAAWAQNPSRVVSPDVAAAAVLKGVFDEPTGAGIAAFSGYNTVQFDHLVQTAGQSIGLAEALLLWRRGQITDAHLTEIVRYSNVNPRFYEDVPKLRYVPPTVGESITGALKGHIPDAQAAEQIGHAGLDPTHFTWLKASAGRPLGLEETLHLWNRQVVDEAFVDASIRQSDINDTYLDAAKALRHYFPPPRSIVPMLRNGAITEAQARRLLGYYGVDQEWSDAFVKEAQHSSGGAMKELTQSQIVASYENRLLDRPTALARLEALTYSPADAAGLLDLADEKRTTALLNATVRMVGARYVAHKLTKPDASHLLATASVPNAAQLDLFALWDIERAANLHYPTPAGIVGAGRRGLLTPAQVKLRLNQLGIADDDLPIFVGDGWPPTSPLAAQAAAHAVVAGLAAWPVGTSATKPTTKNLTVTQIGKLYSAGTIQAAEAITDLVALGYTQAQAQELVTTFAPPSAPPPTNLSVTQISRLYSAGTIGAAEAIADLLRLGYTQAQADQLLTTFTPPVAAPPAVP